MSEQAVVAQPHVAHEVHHEELGFWRKYVFSTDHKVIGIQCAITGLLFLLFGSLMMLMRWQLAYPGAALPLIGTLFGEARMPGGTMLPSSTTSSGRCTAPSWSSSGWSPRRRRIRELRAPAPDWSPGHGVPEAQHGELLVLLPRRRHDAGSFFVPGGPRSPGGPPTRRSPSSRARARRGGSSG